jgi:hypothetical protein
MKFFFRLFYKICSAYVLLVWALSISSSIHAQNSSVHPKVIVMAEANGIHRPFVDSAIIVLKKLAIQNNFTIDYIENAEKINEQFLSQYRLFIQLDYPPYGWSDTAKSAFEKYIKEGRGGWIGFHHATLLGEFDGYSIWPWFSSFMGGIRWKNYIAGFASAKVNIEKADHPVMKGLPASFVIGKEEWYTYDKTPRPNVQVLASVDESTYRPETSIKMGDHPVVWVNPDMKARNVYIFMGHHGRLFDDPNYRLLFTNAVMWAIEK